LIENLPYDNRVKSGQEGAEDKIPPPIAIDASEHSNSLESAAKKKDGARYLRTCTEWLRFTLWKKWLKPVGMSSGFWTAAATVAIFITTMVYTYYARKQWEAMGNQVTAMQNQLTEMQKQSSLMRQQLVGTQAAVVDINEPVSVTPTPLGRKFNITIGFRNDGHVNATGFIAHFKIQVFRIADKTRTGKQWSCDRVVPVIMPPHSDRSFTSEEHPYLQCLVEGLPDEDLRFIYELKRTIALDVSYTYNNGFEEVRKESGCFLFQLAVKTYNGFEGSNNCEDCGLYYVGRGIILQHLKEKPH
jgi:hypothetical protein